MLLLSAGMHWYVYANLKRVLLRDYPKIGKTLAKCARWMFVALDMPFLFIYFRGLVHAEMNLLSRVLLYPFVVWQIIMLMWVLILVPISLWRRLRKLVTYLRKPAPRIRMEDKQGNIENISLRVAAE